MAWILRRRAVYVRNVRMAANGKLKVCDGDSRRVLRPCQKIRQVAAKQVLRVLLVACPPLSVAWQSISWDGMVDVVLQKQSSKVSFATGESSSGISRPCHAIPNPNPSADRASPGSLPRRSCLTIFLQLTSTIFTDARST